MGETGARRVNILFVCTGNICRSPTAEGLFRARAAAAGLDADCDSAGLQGYHVGEPPDSRSIACAAAHGIDLRPLRARAVTPEDFMAFTDIVAMDRGHLRALEAMRPSGGRAILSLFMRHAGADGVDVPDPYYGGEDGFARVFAMIARGVDGLIARETP